METPADQSSTREATDGKVSAVLENSDRIKEITPELQTADIDSFFETDEEENYYLHRWQPTRLNNRILSQSSVFLFGGDRFIEILMHLAADRQTERWGSSGLWNITENGIKVIKGR